jgi:hypothetical protein
MIYNKEMEYYLDSINANLKTANDSMHPCIFQGRNYNSEPYYFLKNNCYNLSTKSNVNSSAETLTQLEWDCNEVRICNSEDIIVLFQTALLEVNSMKDTLKKQYPLQPFDIVMSIDDGKDCEVSPSATIRFYAIRNNYYYISHDKSNLENFAQPILIESVN